MISDRSTSKPSGPVTAAVLLATALLVTGVSGGAVLVGCTSDSDQPRATSTQPSPGASWSVATPDGGTGGTTGTAPPGTGATGTGGTEGPGGTGTEGAPTGAGGTTAPEGPASQPSAEASRDGVEPSIAALPRPSRIRTVPRGASGYTRIVASDGLWVVSRPAGAPDDYAELLHLDGSGTRILRAYPFPGVPPQWLLVTSKAVYCGRRGDAVAPDMMVCRVDRATGDLRVRVAADLAEEAEVTQADVEERPGTWVVDDNNYVADFGAVPEVGTELTFRSNGAELRLSPDTLGLLGS